MRRDVIAAYVEKLLAVLTDTPRVAPDRDGDYPVRFGSALYYVRLVSAEDPDVQVFAVAVDGIEQSPELLAELNDLNCRIRFGRVSMSPGRCWWRRTSSGTRSTRGISATHARSWRASLTGSGRTRRRSTADGPGSRTARHVATSRQHPGCTCERGDEGAVASSAGTDQAGVQVRGEPG
jgi:Putative bacterial sensory transduction regulator